jgi:hypothetical protein
MATTAPETLTVGPISEELALAMTRGAKNASCGGLVLLAGFQFRADGKLYAGPAGAVQAYVCWGYHAAAEDDMTMSWGIKRFV